MEMSKELMREINIQQLSSCLDAHTRVVGEIERLDSEKKETQHQIEVLSQTALAMICKSGEYNLLERAAFAAAIDYSNPAGSIEDFEIHVKEAYHKLSCIDEILKEPNSPMLAYTARRPAKGTYEDAELQEYTLRVGDGKGLEIDEKTTGHLHQRVVYDVNIGEASPTSKHSRPFGSTRSHEPLIARHSPSRLIAWTSGAKKAAEALKKPPHEGHVTHILIGIEEIQHFFDSGHSGEQFDTLYGHAALMGFRFNY